MAKLGISTGSQPNDGTGDSLIDGAIKANSNFTEIYTTIGDGTTLAVPVTSVSAGAGINVSGSTGSVTITNVGIADTNNLRTDFLEVSGISTFQNAFFINPSSNSPATLQIETGAAGVGNTIRSSRSLDLRTNGSAFSVNLDNTSAILAGGTGVSQYVSLYGQGSEKFKTIGAGVTVTGTAYATQFIGGGAGITGISTLNIVNYSGGGGGSGVGTDNVRTNSLVVSGISTFNGTVSVNGHVTFGAGSGNSQLYMHNENAINLGSGNDARIIYNNTENIVKFERSGSAGEIEINAAPVTLKHSDSTKLQTSSTGITVSGSVNATSAQIGAGLNLQYSGNASTILHNSLLGQFNIESVSGINLKPGGSPVSIYSSDDILRIKSTTEGADLYGNINVGLATNVAGFTSTNTVNTPALTLSHNNPTVVSTAGTTGQFKQIGSQPYYYDGTTWRALFLSEAPLTVNQADSDWDNTMIRMNFDQATIGDVTNLKDGRTPSTSQIDLVSSPIKYGTKTARFQVNNTGINFTQDNSGSTYYPFEGAWTLEGWFYFNSSALPTETNISQSPILFANWHPSTNVGSNWKLGYYHYSGSVYNFYWHNKNSSATGSNQPGNTTSGFLFGQYNSSSFADNAWHHIAIVREPENGSIHFYLDGVESSQTNNNELIDNEINDEAGHSFVVGHYGGSGDAGQFEGNIDDIRVSKSARYTADFTPPASALPITGSTTTVYEPADSKVGEISLGGSPAWTGTPGVTASQVAAGQYRATFATAYSNATDYVIQATMNDYTPATTPVSIGVSRFTTHADFFVTRVSDGANIDTGSLAIDLFKK